MHQDFQALDHGLLFVLDHRHEDLNFLFVFFSE